MSEAKIKLLYIQPAPLFGGAERQAAEQASILPRFGVDPTVVAGPGQAIIDWLEAEGVENVVKSGNFPGGWPKQRGLAKLGLPLRVLGCGLRARAELDGLARATRFDVIVASLPFAWFTGSLVAKAHGVPIVWRAGGAYINPAQAAGMWLATRFIRPDLLVCNGQAVKSTFAPVVPAPVAILPNGVDTSVFHPGAGDRSRFRPPGARWVVGYAGRLAVRKRPQDVIELAARLEQTRPGAHVILAGEGSKREEYAALARARGADNVSFLGYVADMPSFYAACDLVVLPSSSEGSSNAVLEAMASGLTVVATDIPPLVEQIEHGVTGLIYPLGDVSAFTRSVESLLDDESLRQAMAARAFEHAQSFTTLAAAERLASLVKELVAAHARQPGSSRETAAEPAATTATSRPRPEPFDSALRYIRPSDLRGSDSRRRSGSGGG
ncbi:MAG TPA: glycosyltransferase family 4 protein [Polyangiaceae bacterium]|nr:glycosyltransferase family 4 protein [Polyangiaceae bacterium]